MAKVRMFTTTSCSDCRAAKRYLADIGFDYEEINIEQVEGAAEIVLNANAGRRSVPTFEIDGRFFNCSPFDRRKLAAALGLDRVQGS